VTSAAQVPVTCGRCTAAAAGPIWRGIIAVPTGETHYGIPLNDYVPGVLCWECGQREQSYGYRNCAWCGRAVYYGGYNAHPVRYCTRRCELAARTDRRRLARQLGRQRRCETCGTGFTAPRQDACYCSPACRQRAYRKRQADAAAKREYDARMVAEWDAGLS
jgi:hypothetical protein